MSTSHLNAFDFELDGSSESTFEPIPSYLTLTQDDNSSFLDILGGDFDAVNYPSLFPCSSGTPNISYTEATHVGSWLDSAYFNSADIISARSPLNNANDNFHFNLPDTPPAPDSRLDSKNIGQRPEKRKKQQGRPSKRSKTASPGGSNLGAERGNLPPDSPDSPSTIISHATRGTHEHGESWYSPTTTDTIGTGNADTHDGLQSSHGRSSMSRVQGIHRAYNRVAATKYRSKRALEEHTLQEEERTLHEKHSGLVEEVQGLQEQLYALKKEMFGHADCCPRIRSYLLLSAENVSRNNSLSVSRGGNGT